MILILLADKGRLTGIIEWIFEWIDNIAVQSVDQKVVGTNIAPVLLLPSKWEFPVFIIGTSPYLYPAFLIGAWVSTTFWSIF
jgi:hypothetical protein